MQLGEARDLADCLRPERPSSGCTRAATRGSPASPARASRASISIATDARTTRPAAISRPPTCSPTNAQPRNTATAGFTYAYVERSGVERVPQQPAVRRERDERAEDDEEERARRATRPRSATDAPAALAASRARSRRAARPPSASASRRPRTARAAAARRARTRSRQPRRRTRRGGPPRRAGRRCPTARRGSRRRRGRSRCPATAPSGSRMPKQARSISAMKSGTLATRSAAVPDGTRCTAQATPPVSSTRSAVPTIAAARHSRRPGRTASSPRRAATGVEERAGDQEAHGEHQERRQRPVGHGHAEVRRSPDDVDDRECAGELHALQRACADRIRTNRVIIRIDHGT